MLFDIRTATYDQTRESLERLFDKVDEIGDGGWVCRNGSRWIGLAVYIDDGEIFRDTAVAIGYGVEDPATKPVAVTCVRIVRSQAKENGVPLPRDQFNLYLIMSIYGNTLEPSKLVQALNPFEMGDVCESIEMVLKCDHFDKIKT